ncbi:MAG: MoaD/ThiS family protein, partial [Candidatus Nanopelagicaceae bacterium]
NLSALIDHLVAINSELAKLIPTCSFLINGTAAESNDQILVEGDVVDVLPQFAGG